VGRERYLTIPYSGKLEPFFFSSFRSEEALGDKQVHSIDSESCYMIRKRLKLRKKMYVGKTIFHHHSSFLP
jgi:hypothetical protein